MASEELKNDAPQMYMDSVLESSNGKTDLLSLENVDPVLNAKMHLVNNVSTTQKTRMLYCHLTCTRQSMRLDSRLIMPSCSV
jgi:hypothetical protein